MSRLSIIIPHYNSPDLLIKLLDSIPKNDEIQIIVVDDKSDKNLDIYMKIKTNGCYSHINFFDNMSDVKSAGTCRNIGLSKAIGQWVLFADADDYFLEGFYDKVSVYFDSENDVVFFPPTSIEIDTGNSSGKHKLYSDLISNYMSKGDLSNELKLRYRFYVPWSKLINKQLLDENEICFDETIVSNDQMFSTRVGYYTNKFEVSDSIIYCVTKNQGSLTTIIRENIIDIRLEKFIEYYKYLRERLSLEEMKLLDISGIQRLLSVYYAGLGIKKILSAYKMLRTNKIPIITLRKLNPIYFIKEAIQTLIKWEKAKKYQVK